MMRTTCVATRLEGGHAGNALPQAARALVNCRVLPGEPIDGVREAIVRAVGDPGITVTQPGQPELSQPSSLRPDLMRVVESTTAALWPGIPAYGVSGLFLGPDDARSHGLNERMPVASLWGGQEFLYRVVKGLAGGR